MTADQTRIDALEKEVTRLSRLHAEAARALGERGYASRRLESEVARLQKKEEDFALVLSRAEALERELEQVRMSRDHFKSLVQNAEAGERSAVMKYHELDMRSRELLELFDKSFPRRVRKFWQEKVECFQLMIKKPVFSWHNKE